MTISVRQHRLWKDGSRVEFIRSPYVGGPFAAGRPRILVMHFTYGAGGRSSANWFADPNRPNGSSAQIVIDRDGSLIQCVEFGTVAWHAGKSRLRDIDGLNAHSIGIELANWGYLQRTGSGWASYTGVKIPDPVIATHRNGNPDGVPSPCGWEPYPQAQLDAAVDVARVLVREYGIKEIVGHDDISKGRKWDPGPAFDMARFRAQVFGEDGEDGDTRMRVMPADGLNLRTGPGVHFAAIEKLPAGTIVDPIGADGNWVEVSVLTAAAAPRATGWVHGEYLADA